MIYNKLVRDKIPEIIQRKGGTAITRIADEQEYWEKLKEKLLEEVKEFCEAENEEEMADIFEVIDAICTHKNFLKETIADVQKKKYEERGGFVLRIILEES